MMRYGPYHVEGLNRKQIRDPVVKCAMSRVPRHRFVPEELLDSAYDDRALPIGHEQTISQPFVVALMTSAAQVKPGHRVLEIGTGSGYQAAVLAELGAVVYSVEIIPELAARATSIFHELEISGITVRVGDGWEGWSEFAPYDAILITAACPRLPQHLFDQLTDNGRIVFPLESENQAYEELLLFERHSGQTTRRSLGSVRFVPLVGAARTDRPQESSQAARKEGK